MSRLFLAVDTTAPLCPTATLHLPDRRTARLSEAELERLGVEVAWALDVLREERGRSGRSRQLARAYS